MVLLAVFCLPSLAAEASGDEKVNRFNVVMVTDASGSMSDTDPEGYRYEAINLFVALLANGGNHVGSVVFSNDVSEEQDPVEVTGRPEKTEITDGIQGQEVGGWTDIGGALEEAVDMLEEDGGRKLALNYRASDRRQHGDGHRGGDPGVHCQEGRSPGRGPGVRLSNLHHLPESEPAGQSR